MSTTQDLIKAADAAGAARNGLQAALRTADPVAALLILQLIGQAQALLDGVLALRAAREPQ